MAVFKQFDQVTKEQSKLIEDNIKLVYYVLNRYKAMVVIVGEAEAESSLLFALCKAAISYNPMDKSKSKFTTYAVSSMINELKMGIKKVNSKIITNSISLETPAGYNDEGLAISIEENQLTSINNYDELYNEIFEDDSLDYLKEINFTTLEKTIIELYKEHECTIKTKIAKFYYESTGLTISKSHLSKIVKSIKNKIISYKELHK